jgi:hypothetical protein
MTSGDGPINRIPASTHASAKSDRSDKNPYPGWIASTSFSCQKNGFIFKKFVPSLVPNAKFRNLDLFLTPFQNKRAKCFYGPSITHKNVKNMSCDDGHLN